MHPKHKQQGSMLIISIFVIVVMTLLGLTINQLLSSASSSIVYEVGGLRALNAARSGLEAQLALQFPLHNLQGASSCQGPYSRNFGNVEGLNSCSVTVSCSCSTHTFNGIANNYFRISSTGSCNLSGEIMSRTIAVETRVQTSTVCP